MKKFLSILLVLALAVTALSVALADEDFESVPQPEGGKKFESDWALPGTLVNIVYEEMGYRVLIEKQDLMGGSIWEYSCYYHEDTDCLMSVSSLKRGFTIDPETFERVDNDCEYEGLDLEDGEETTFVINEDGALVWNDGRENAGEGLAFADIGSFTGVWRSKEGEEPVVVEAKWNGMNEDEMFYTVYIHRGDDDIYTEFLMNGWYNAETGKLECMGTAMSFSRNADGDFDTVEDGENYDAFFSKTENGTLLYETANGIELEYDLLGFAN